MNCIFCKNYRTQNGKCKGLEYTCGAYEDIKEKDYKTTRQYLSTLINNIKRLII